MPGHDLRAIGDVKPSLLCPECGLILKEAVQTCEGERFCKECFDAIAQEPNLTSSKTGICVKDDEDGNELGFYLDNAVRKEVRGLKVFCEKSGCDWKGPLSHYENHKKDCPIGTSSTDSLTNHGSSNTVPSSEDVIVQRLPKRSMTNDQYAIHILRNLLEWFNVKRPNELLFILNPVLNAMSLPQLAREKCSSTPVLIQEYISLVYKRFYLAESTKHLLRSIERYVKSDIPNITALRVMSEAYESSEREAKMAQQSSSYLKDNHTEYSTEAVKGDCLSLSSNQSNGSVGSEGNGAPLRDYLSGSYGDSGVPTTRRSESADLNEGLIRTLLADNSSSSLKDITLVIQKQLAKHTATEELHIHRSLLERIINQLKELPSLLENDVERDRNLHLSPLGMSCNGTFSWKILDIGQQTRDAIENRDTSLYSPPFYTSQDGYKMCMRVYLNGDGMGCGTHLSVFFVLMRGEYDNILKWPFEYKVTMTLINQENRLDNIVNSFQPDPKSSSFQKPTSDMNIASGCPQFATLNLLGPSDGFVADDTIFIKCSVDTTHLPQ